MKGSPRRRALDAAREWPLTGRAVELLEMGHQFEAGGRGVVLAGAAGVGKTRLATELLARVEGAGGRTVRVIGTRAASGIPLGAFAPVVPPPSRGRGSGVDDRAYHLNRCAQHLVAQAEGRKLAILVDDAHLLDDASATLVYQLAAYSRAFVLVTVRANELCPDPILALWKDDTLRRMEVTGLSHEAMDEVLHAVLGSSVDQEAVRGLAAASDGNIMFLRELVLGGLADGTLRFEQGIWRHVGIVSPSTRLTGLVAARLSELVPEERVLMELLAVGEPLDAAELQKLGDPATAEDLERRGFLVGQMDGRRLGVRLAHPIYADVLKAKMPALRRRELARLLAESVEATGVLADKDVLRVAGWRLEAGGPADPKLYFEAARIARWRYDFALAARLALAAREAGAGFEASFLAAQVMSVQGRGPEAERLLAELADGATTDQQRGVVACARFDHAVLHLGQIDRGLVMAEAAEAQISDPEWRDNLAARRGAIVFGTSGPRTHMELFGTLHERARGGAFVHSSIVAAHSLARVGRLTDARLTAERAFETQSKLTEHFDRYPWTHLFFRYEALAQEGRIDDAVGAAEAQYRRGVRDGSSEQQAWFAWQLCRMSFDRGYVRRAAQYGRKAVTLFQRLGWPLFEHFALIHLAVVHGLAGDAVSAEEALARNEALDLPDDFFFPVDLELARGWIAAATDDLQAAARRFGRAAEIGAEIGDLLGQSHALHALARIGRAGEVVEALAALTQHVEGDLIAIRAAHAQALSDGDGAGLEQVVDRFQGMGATMLAAEAAADAAVVWRRAQEGRRAARCEHRATSLARTCEHPATPALGAIQGPEQLTNAQRQTAMLAIEGRSNKEIAAHLAISVRTVENHLQRSYQKLGISGRCELAASLGNATNGTLARTEGRRLGDLPFGDRTRRT